MGLPVSVGGDIAQEAVAFEAFEFSAHGAYFAVGEQVGNDGVTRVAEEVDLLLG